MPEETPEDGEKHALKVLATAKALDVPVYPNTEEVAPELARLHRQMLIEGFEILDVAGEPRRVILKASPAGESTRPISLGK